CQQGHGLPFTF
nr:immunoglobulin light chain junction region [Macaca mulatta]